MARAVIMVHGDCLLTAALDADENFVVQIKSAVGGFDPLEPQLATTVLAARRWRWLDKGTHTLSPSLNGMQSEPLETISILRSILQKPERLALTFPAATTLRF